jgi:hypothetical protein
LAKEDCEAFRDGTFQDCQIPLNVSYQVQMDWMIPEKLKKRVSYAQFSLIIPPFEGPGMFFIIQ